MGFYFPGKSRAKAEAEAGSGKCGWRAELPVAPFRRKCKARIACSKISCWQYLACSNSLFFAQPDTLFCLTSPCKKLTLSLPTLAIQPTALTPFALTSIQQTTHLFAHLLHNKSLSINSTCSFTTLVIYHISSQIHSVRWPYTCALPCPSHPSFHNPLHLSLKQPVNLSLRKPPGTFTHWSSQGR